jgi:anti-sigma B factor antagonist
LEISVRKRGQVDVIQLKGAFRLGQAVDDLRRTMEELFNAGNSRLVLNMVEVPTLDSSAIGLLVRFLTSAKQRGGNLKLTSPSKFTVQTLKLVGVLSLFEVFETDDAAIESFA